VDGVGVPFDIGWGIAVVNADHTITRTCKGCGAGARSAIDPATGRVARAAITHREACPVIDRLGNNPALS
jgi:hypothetical protein